MTDDAEVRAATIQKLRDARALIAKPENWAKGAFAYSIPSTELQYVTDNAGKQSVDLDLQSGILCSSESVEAKSFCPLGAISRAALGSGLFARVACLLEDEMNGHISGFNDHKDTTHEMVLAAFDRAIAKLEAPTQNAQKAA